MTFIFNIFINVFINKQVDFVMDGVLLCFIIIVYYTLDVFTKIDLKTKTIILLLWIQNANLKIIINHMK